MTFFNVEEDEYFMCPECKNLYCADCIGEHLVNCINFDSCNDKNKFFEGYDCECGEIYETPEEAEECCEENEDD